MNKKRLATVEGGEQDVRREIKKILRCRTIFSSAVSFALLPRVCVCFARAHVFAAYSTGF